MTLAQLIWEGCEHVGNNGECLANQGSEREREMGNRRSVEHNWVRHVNTKNCNKHDSEATRTEMICDRVSTKQKLKN